jgi:predicted esterase
VHKPGVIGLLAGLLLIAGCSDSNLAYPTAAPATGPVQLRSEGLDRTYYLVMPDDYDPDGPPKPLLFAYHGTGGKTDAWLDGTYDLLDYVQNDAIVVLAQAKPDRNGVNQWDYDVDFQYFEDVLADVRRKVTYDPDKLFITGHSSGAGMSHELGCNYGDLVRGIAPHSGIMRSTRCIGSVAVFQSHGNLDTLVPAGTGEAGHQFWTLYNGFQSDVYGQGLEPFCIDHSLGASPFPVQWCLHDEQARPLGHDWPSFASEQTWRFFTTLIRQAPGEQPPAGGGNDAVGTLADTTLSFTLEYPPGIVDPTQGAISIYPAGTQQPLTGGPQSILNFGFAPGDVGPGSVKSYVVPIRYINETFPGTYAFAVSMYVAAGGNPIPLPGKDHIVLTDVDVVDRNNPVIIDQTLLLEVIEF